VILFFQFKEVRFHLGSFDQEIGTLSWKTLPKSWAQPSWSWKKNEYQHKSRESDR